MHTGTRAGPDEAAGGRASRQANKARQSSTKRTRPNLTTEGASVAGCSAAQSDVQAGGCVLRVEVEWVGLVIVPAEHVLESGVRLWTSIVPGVRVHLLAVLGDGPDEVGDEAVLVVHVLRHAHTVLHRPVALLTRAARSQEVANALEGVQVVAAVARARGGRLGGGTVLRETGGALASDDLAAVNMTERPWAPAQVEPGQGDAVAGPLGGW
mmetsp:Transcript_87175/g.270784  ORF Transcript_87175/g.270784 Transcript_87175/m.270784 type:complete len:211 (+) Transcript_87175:199-831(+)